MFHSTDNLDSIELQLAAASYHIAAMHYRLNWTYVTDAVESGTY